MALSVVRTISLTAQQIQVLFTDVLDSNIGIANVVVTSQLDSIGNPTTLSVEIDNDVLVANFTPMFADVQYQVSFISTSGQSFQSVNGDAIFEGGNRNKFFIVSPGESQNAVRDSMLDELSVVYESEEPSSIRNVITSIAGEFNKALLATETVKSGNYLSVTVDDEIITRDDGPIDRFSNGGTYEILRVGASITAALLAGSVNFSATRESSFLVRSGTIINSIVADLPADPISLQSIDIVDEQVGDDINADNYFSGLRVKVSNRPVMQVISVTLERDGIFTPYDIEVFGYTLRDNSYDTDSASLNVNLEDGEIDLSSSSITGGSGGFLQPKAGDSIYVSYVYKRLGREIDTDTVLLSTIRTVTRETTPAIIGVFTLDHAPIVLSSGATPSLNGAQFLNTVVQGGNPPFTVAHSAFTSEIVFDVARSPGRPGEFSVDYNTGDVFVFGEDTGQTGTGENPPAVDYLYRHEFIDNLDYTFDSDTNDLALRSTRDISGIEAGVSFNYEDVFAIDEDFRFLSHVETLSERVDNRLVDAFAVQTQNYPVSNVFRIFNETTGELYSLSRFNDSTIFFTGRDAPAQIDVIREQASFSRVPQEVLLVSDELTNTALIRVFQINLAHRELTSSRQRFVGSSFNTSVLFSDEDIFQDERFYEDRLFDSVSTNIDRLASVGEYLVDYNNGIVYVAVTATQNTDIGDISYEYSDAVTKNDHILSVDNIYRSSSSIESNAVNYTIGSITDTTVNVGSLEQAGERFINDNPTRPILVGSYQNGEDGITSAGGFNFVSNSATFTESDIGRTLRLGSSNKPPSEDLTISGIISSKEVLVSSAITDGGTGRVWNILDLSTGADKIIALQYNISDIQNIYLASQLGTLTALELDGYYDINTDTFDANLVTLADTNNLEVGDAVIVNYNYGEIFADYRYLHDDLVVSYEYGYNSLDWGISSALSEGETYFVTYKYGALRDSLLTNFGSLTQIPVLTSFPDDLDREVYRSVVGGTLQSFVEGPTIPSIERLVESFTGVTPDIEESTFSNWVLGRDFLNLRAIESKVTPEYDLGRHDNGIIVRAGQALRAPAVSNFRLDEGTLESWIRPDWPGYANDAELTFDLYRDGYNLTSDVYIGFSAVSPTTMPFTLDTSADGISVIGRPLNFYSGVGYFIWFDELNKKWMFRWRDNREDVGGHTFSGTISANGEFFNIVEPVSEDGYELNEINDLITSRVSSIEFDAVIDFREGPTGIGDIDGGAFLDMSFIRLIDGGSFFDTVFVGFVDGGFYTDTDYGSATPDALSGDGLEFAAGKIHYLFDMAQRADANRVSIFKDGHGYLNFQVYDNAATINKPVGTYSLSTDVRDWNAGDLHHIAISWRFNSYNERDEMHLFVDGQEVPNLFKYGGSPATSSLFTYGAVAEETAIDSSTGVIVGDSDGVSTSGSALFVSVDTDFEAAGVLIGNTLNLLEDNADGTLSSNGLGGGAYTITGVGANTITVDTTPAPGLTLSISAVTFSINQSIQTVSTPVNFQDFIVVDRDAYGVEVELNGLAAESPDYSISRGSSGAHILSINNGIEIGHSAVIKPLGLTFRRCRDNIFSYGETDVLRFNGPPPVSLDDVDITAISFPSVLIADGYVWNSEFEISSGALEASFGGDGYLLPTDGYLCQPSNQVAGRTLALTLNSENIDFTGDNTVTINGETAPDVFGSVSFSVVYTFSETEIIVTDELWKRIDSIEMRFTPIDITDTAGTIDIREFYPINVSEAGGDFAEVVSYDNGVFRIEIYGSGGMPFSLGQCDYEIDYPSYLKLRVDGQPRDLIIGSDYTETHSVDAIVDEFRILRELSGDTRAGETVDSGGRTITTDYVNTQPFGDTDETTMLAHFDDDLEKSDRYIDAFDQGFRAAASVNDNFVRSLRADNGMNPYILSNAGGAFNNNEGTIEFWVSPMDDSRDDPGRHFYVDMLSVISEELTSRTRINVITSQRIRTVESVRLKGDTTNTGTNYYIGGSVSNIDSKTITLGTPLPAQNIGVKVTYTPLNTNGDRVSVYKDGDGFVNFFMRANGVDFNIAAHVDWRRHSWHRVMVMWKANSLDGTDRLRLFVDGFERGTIKYGTGLLYGDGIIYGQEDIRSGVQRFVVSNIDLEDTFGRIVIGADVFGAHSARARMDNMRFSEIERLQSIKIVGDSTVDVNYQSNTELAEPVLEDIFTKRILNFDKEISDVEFLATIVNSERGIFRFTVGVIDSFDRVIGNTRLEDLLLELINTIKPAHTEAIVNFVE